MAVNCHARCVDVRVRRRKTCDGLCLLFGPEIPDVAVHDFAPCRPFGRRRTAVVERQHDVALVRNGAKSQACGPPLILDQRVRRLAIDIDQHGIPPRRIEVGGLDHHRIERHAVFNRHLRELDGLFRERCCLSRKHVVGHQRANHAVIGQRNEIDTWR